MSDNEDSVFDGYHPIQEMKMHREIYINDLHNDIQCLKFVSTSTCIACNVNMIMFSMFLILL